MKIQLALDRLTIEQAIELVRLTEESIDWIEVGTSLIKEYGITSIQRIKEAFPEKVVVADVKTIDNARYEFDLCYKAGADVATVMGVSPLVTIQACMERAADFDKTVMIDLLNTTEEQKTALYELADDRVIYCDHVSKDEQELNGERNKVQGNASLPPIKRAVAGGITLASLDEFKQSGSDVFIIGSAITKAENPREAAKAFKKILLQWKEGQK